MSLWRPQTESQSPAETYKLPTDHVKNINGKYLWEHLQLIDMPQENQKHRGTTIYMDQHILIERKSRRENLAKAWIDNKMAYGMVYKSWILHCLKMYEIPNYVVQCIEKTMETWRVELTERRKCLAELKIQRSIFQGDALSLLLFVIARMPLNHVLKKFTAGYKPSKSQEKINSWYTW